MLKTERLILRKFKEDDFDDYYEMISPFAKEYFIIKNTQKAFKQGLVNEMPSFIFKYPEIIENINNEKNNFDCILKRKDEYAICLNSNQKLIGEISLSLPGYYIPKDFSPIWSREIGVILNKDYRNKGYMTEATKCIVKYIMTETELRALYARILSDNGASMKLFDKCGFKFLYEREEDINFNKCSVTAKGIKKEDLSPFYDDVNYESI